LIESSSKNQAFTKLYSLPGIETPAEFPNEKVKKMIEKDILNFPNLGPYHPTTFD
jgi:hypothetical protein